MGKGVGGGVVMKASPLRIAAMVVALTAAGSVQHLTNHEWAKSLDFDAAETGTEMMLKRTWREHPAAMNLIEIAAVPS